MKLKDFVSQTLLDITNGVEEAQKRSPHWIAPGFVEGEKVVSPQLVAFDILVTVNKEAGGGIQVWSLGDLSAKGNSEQSNRMSFSVPVYFQAPKKAR